ncbi:MAG: Ig-like domain-containing protein [Marinicellaceae bacterium]
MIIRILLLALILLVIMPSTAFSVISVCPDSIRLDPKTVPPAHVAAGKSYGPVTISASPFNPGDSYVFSITQGVLPNGLILENATNEQIDISGIAEIGGQFIYTLTATNSVTGCSGSRVFGPTVFICGDGNVDMEVGEQCDDNNILNGDGCSAACLIENTQPVAVDDVFMFNENGIEVGNLLLNDFDDDATDVLKITSADGAPIDPALGGAVLFNIESANGRDAEIVVSENFGFNFAFNPTSEFDDLAVNETDLVTFMYEITDNNGGSDSASVTVTVNGENDDPLAVDDSFMIDEGELLTVDILGNDTDIDSSDQITITGGNGNAVGAAFTVTSEGGREAFAILAASGNLNLAVDQIGNFEDLAVGETDIIIIDYNITDGNGGNSSATVNITINGLNDNPMAIDDDFTFNENGIEVENLLLNDFDDDASDVLQITSAGGGMIDPALGGAVLFNVESANGRNAEIVVSENFGFNFAFNPKLEFDDLAVNETDSFTFMYEINDNNGGSDTAIVTGTVNGENDDPVAVDDSFMIGEGELLTVDILGNDTDLDTSDAITITGGNGNAVGVAFSVTSEGGREAFAILAASGNLNLAVDQIGNFEDLVDGETDTIIIEYNITDGNGGNSTANVTITVNGSNDLSNKQINVKELNSDVFLNN